MEFKTEIKEIEVNNHKIGVIEIPVAGSAVQFVLTSNVNEIVSVGIATFDGEIAWKFGKPLEKFLPLIEEGLRKIFKCGEYWEG